MLPADTFKGQVAIVTGGATGIGNAIAHTLGKLGAKVVLASRKEAVLEQAVQRFKEEDVEAFAVPTDVRIPEQVDRLISETLNRFGRLDILVNNAAGNFVSPAEALSPNGFRTVVDIVLNGTFYCSRAAANHWMQDKKSGSIVNILATYAWTGGPGVAHSAAAKAGVWNLTMTLAAEWGSRGIRVNAVAPGIVVTDHASKNLGYDDPKVQTAMAETVPLRRLASTEEVANAVSYLASAYASYVTGSCLTIDGGHSLGRGMFGIIEDLSLRQERR